MGKLKTKKTLSKRIKVTSKGKLLRRHQLAAGHLKRKKSKGALEQHKKSVSLFKGDVKKFKGLMGV